MIRLKLAIELDYDVAAPSDFIFNIHAAHTERQQVLDECLSLSQNVPATVDTDLVTHNRYLRLSALPGHLQVRYSATVDLLHHVEQPANIAEVPVARLPTRVLGYIYPSRYCQSDRLLKLAAASLASVGKATVGCRAFAIGCCSTPCSRRTARTATPRRSTPCCPRWACAATSPT